MTDAFLGRQPIYDRDLELYAFELLYRGGDVDFADFVEGDRATSQVLLNTLTDFGMDRVVGNHPAFLNLTRGFIIGEYPLPVPRERVVLEVLEEVPPDDEVLEGLRRLRSQGYRIALDDFVYCEENERFLPYADIIKVDVQGLGAREIREKAELLAPSGAELLAEKIETPHQLDACRELGFEYLQGYFLSRPRVLRTGALPVCRSGVVRLLALLQDPRPDEELLLEGVRNDLPLAFRLVHHASAVRRRGAPLRSVDAAVRALGPTGLKSFATLTLLGELEEAPDDLILSGRFRGRMCEGLARAAGLPHPERHFTVGLFSALDTLVDIPFDRLVDELPLDEELRSALVDRTGVHGESLRATLASERGEWEGFACFGLPLSAIHQAFREAARGSEAERSSLLRAA